MSIAAFSALVCAASSGLPARTSEYGRPCTSACTVVRYEFEPTESCAGMNWRARSGTPIFGSFAHLRLEMIFIVGLRRHLVASATSSPVFTVASANAPVASSTCSSKAAAGRGERGRSASAPCRPHGPAPGDGTSGGGGLAHDAVVLLDPQQPMVSVSQSTRKYGARVDQSA